MSRDPRVQELGTHSPNLSLNSFTDEETEARERKVLATAINPVSNEEASMGLLLKGHLTGWGWWCQVKGGFHCPGSCTNTLHHRALEGGLKPPFSASGHLQSLSQTVFFFFSLSKIIWIDPVIGVLNVRQSKALWWSAVINKLCETFSYPCSRVRMKSTAWPRHVANASNQCPSCRKSGSHSYPMSLPWVLTKMILTEHRTQGLVHTVSAQ